MMRGNYYHGKKHSTIAIIAVAATVVGGIIAVVLYLRKKAADISEKLDFDSDLYYDEEDYFDSSEKCDCCKESSEKCGCGEPETIAESLANESEPTETIEVSDDDEEKF